MSDTAPLPWPPIEPPKARVQFPDLSRLGDEWVVGVTRTLNPGLVLQAYRAGIFPWPSKPGVIPWASRARSFPSRKPAAGRARCAAI
jgi:hypothetical protein